MNKITMSGKWVLIVVVVLVVLAVAWSFGMKKGGNQESGGTGTSSPAMMEGTSTNPTQSVNKGSSAAGIYFTAPAANAVWKIAVQNSISWSKETGYSGQIDLLDATTHALVGVILNQVGPHQTSYAWNTRDLLPTRTDPIKKDVVPGTYVVEVQFDGGHVSTMVSGPITITQ